MYVSIFCSPCNRMDGWIYLCMDVGRSVARYMMFIHAAWEAMIVRGRVAFLLLVVISSLLLISFSFAFFPGVLAAAVETYKGGLIFHRNSFPSPSLQNGIQNCIPLNLRSRITSTVTHAIYRRIILLTKRKASVAILELVQL